MKMKLKMILLSVVPLVLVVSIICVICGIKVESEMSNIIKTDLKAIAELEYSAISIVEGNSFSVESGDLVNSNILNITKNTEMVDLLSKECDIEVTVFYGDVRYMTTIIDETGARQVGTAASGEVVDVVLKKGQQYFSEDVDVLGESFYGYYVPIYNANSSTPVGMVFAGKSADDVSAEIMTILSIIMIVGVVGVMVCVAFIFVAVSKMSKRISYGVATLEELADGNLAIDIDQNILKNKDETGDIVKSIKDLKDKLGAMVTDIVGKSGEVKESSNVLSDGAAETTIAVEQVEKAINEIAEGATSQANDTQKATENVIVMGRMIDETTDNIEKLHEKANNMEAQGNEATDILKELSTVNDKAMDSLDVIYNQTNITNESVQKISEAVRLITSIADETNLLSLNASIEAARAGEQGRGFAVVAAQIQKLAEQSNESALQIEAIVSELMAASHKEVEIMTEVKDIMAKQNEMVEKTDQVVTGVIEGISQSRRDIETISEATKRLEESRVTVVDIVQNLSAIAEENAASTEETSASATEVNATIQEMSGNAAHLRTIADELGNSVKVFNI